MNVLRNLFWNGRLFIAIAFIVMSFTLAYFFPSLLLPAKISLYLLIATIFLDAFMMFRIREGIQAERVVPDKLSNGDDNSIVLTLFNAYPYAVDVRVIDELPIQFQVRDFQLSLNMAAGGRAERTYTVRPLTRGAYEYGDILVFAAGPIGLIVRRFCIAQKQTVPVYPSFIQMRKYQLLAISNRLTEMGIKKIRRVGHSTEFEQIKGYVRGDDYRTINWKATARTSNLMVNQFADEKSQHVYCLIDKSRVMKMPFEGMSLLDYAINTSLVLSNIALYKQDKAGLITFAERLSSVVLANRSSMQMNLIMETLYNQQTRFLESDYERLYGFVKRNITHRSLLVLFTNFETLNALKRQIPFLQKLAKIHLLVTVFFENTELKNLVQSKPENTEEIYIKTIGEWYAFEKRQMLKELEQHGIMGILTPPKQLTVNTLNKYLELKSRHMI